MRLSISKSIVALMLGAGMTAQAGIYSYAGGSYAIPDGTRAGVSSQITVSGWTPSSPIHIAVNLNVSGGYNGDLYAYLSYNGTLVPLLNQIGVSSGNPFGASGSGLNVTVSDSGSVNIHAAGDGVLSGTYEPDGQNISPLSNAGSFNANGGSITLDGTFGNINPNGTWTLFFADVSAGGGTSTLNGWSLDITPVAEPVNLALGVFAGVFLVVSLARWGWRVRGRIHRYQLYEREHAQHTGRRRSGQLEPYVFRYLACVRTGERGARGIWRACVAGVGLGRRIHARAKA
jgi:subtilisin-like proprotein convertase family protein